MSTGELTVTKFISPQETAK